MPTSLGDSHFVPVGGGWRGVRAAGVCAGWYGVRIPIRWSVGVDVHTGRKGVPLQSVIVIGAGRYKLSVVVGTIVAMVGFLTGEGEVDP